MTFPNPFKKPPAPTIHDEIHKYTADLSLLSRELQRAEQKYVLSKGSQASKAEVDRLTTAVEVIQVLIARLVEKANKEMKEQS